MMLVIDPNILNGVRDLSRTGIIMGIKDFYEVSCDNPNCGAVARYRCVNLGHLVERLRADGWAVGRKNRTCYCPECAPHYRSVGRSGLDYRCLKNLYPPPD
jgi:tRNA(Ile2) C34 agmatinyltransferase TiaS